MTIADQDRQSLPPNIERAWELLREDGPLSVDELSGRLRVANLVLPVDRLAALPDRYPSHFRAPAGAGIEALIPSRQNGMVDEEPLETGDSWLDTPALPALKFADVVVIDIETTGLDRDVDRIWEIAAVRLDQSESFHCRIAIEAELGAALPPAEDGVRTLSLPDALRELEKFVAGAEVIAGQNVAEFDLPFLASAAKTAGVSWNVPTDVVDLLELSVLALPGLPNRRLGDLCRALDIPGGSPHRVHADAETTGAVIRALIAGIEAPRV